MSDLAKIWELSLVCFLSAIDFFFNFKQSNFILPLIPPQVLTICADCIQQYSKLIMPRYGS